MCFSKICFYHLTPFVRLEAKWKHKSEKITDETHCEGVTQYGAEDAVACGNRRTGEGWTQMM